ncbi:hypothetical protein [Halovivax cerinus]|nr:hypothetical protein [Halovivax cerinus]
MEISTRTAVSVVFAILLTTSLVAMPVLAAGPDPFDSDSREDVRSLYRTADQSGYEPSSDSIYGPTGHPFVSPDATPADGATRATPVDAEGSPFVGGPPLGYAPNSTFDREAILEEANLSPELVDLIDGDGIVFPDGRDSTASVASVEAWNARLAAATDEFAYNTSVEALLAASATLDELDLDEEWADELGNVTASVNATTAAYRSANRVTSVDAYENATDAQERLRTLATEFGADEDDPLENASDDLSEATQRTAELAVDDGYRVVKTYNETIYSTDAYDQAQFKLMSASLALAGAEQVRNESIPENASAANESVYRMGRTVLATYFEKTAWTAAQKAIDVVAADVEPTLSVDHRRPIETNGSILVPIEAHLSGVRSYAYDAEVALEGDSEPVAVSFDGSQPPGSLATGEAPVVVDRDTEAVTVTVTAMREDSDRTTSTSATIEIDRDEVVPDRPDPDEPQEVTIDDEASGASVTARGLGLHASDVRVTNVTPDGNTSAYASPIVDVQNASSFENATVSIPFDASRLDAEANLSIVHLGVGQGDDGWRALETEVDAANATARANVTSFSRFAVVDPDRIRDSTSEFIEAGWPVLDDFQSVSDWDTAGSVSQQDGLAVLESDPPDDGGGGGGGDDPEGPTAKITGPSVVNFKEERTWSGATSSGDDLSYHWTGAAEGTGSTITKTFFHGPMTVEFTLTVTDDEGRTDSTTKDVQVICPSGSCPEPYEANESAGPFETPSPADPQPMDARTSTMDRTVSIAEGVESAELNSRVRTDVEPEGVARITVTGEDGETRVLFERGEESGSPVDPSGPTARITGPDTANYGDEYTWSGKSSSGEGLSYLWSGAIDDETGPTVTKAFLEGKTSKQITLTVTDDEGRSDATTKDVQVICPSGFCPERFEANETNVTTADSATTRGGEWRDVSADISEYAGEEVTITFEAADGATLSAEYASVLVDSAGSGIPDVAEELDLHMPAAGEGQHLFSPLALDPTVADTDGDGLRDDDEVDIAVSYVHSSSGGKLRGYVSQAYSHPARVDSTGDGLTDPEQTEGWLATYATNEEQTETFLEELDAAEDIGDLDEDILEETRVFADPLVEDTDGDGLSDADELRYGTDPEATDTTGDGGVSDGEALTGAYDPRLYDLRPPSIEVWDASYDGEPIFEGTYHTEYYVEDPAGLAESEVLYNEEVRETHSLDGVSSEPIDSAVTIGAAEMVGDMFSGSTIAVTAADRNGNVERVVAYERTNLMGQISEELRAQGLSHATVEYYMGVLSGLTSGAGEIYGFLLALYKKPVETITAITEIVDVITNFTEVIASLPGAIDAQQEQNNPHAPGSEFYQEYRIGWYEGYVAWFILEALVPGGAIVKAVKNTKRFQKIASKLDAGEINRAAKLAGRVKHTTETQAKFARTQLSRGLAKSAGVSREVSSRVLRSVQTSGQLLRRAKHARHLDDETLEVLADGSGEVAEGYRRATLKAADGDAISSYNQIDRAVKKIDELEGQPKLRAQRLVRSTRGHGIRLVDDLDDEAFEAFVRMDHQPGFKGSPDFDQWRKNLALGESGLDSWGVSGYLTNVHKAANHPRITKPDGLVTDITGDGADAAQIRGQIGEARSAVRYADDGAEVAVEPGNGGYDLGITRNGQTEYVDVKTAGGETPLGGGFWRRQVDSMNDKFENADDVAREDAVLEVQTKKGASELDDAVSELNTALFRRLKSASSSVKR